MKKNLEQWLAEQRENLSTFAQHWRYCQREEGEENFPMEMESWNWDEQFEFYQEEI